MTPDIGIIIPTRGRVRQARELIENIFSTADHPAAIKIALCIDIEDDDYHRYKIFLDKNIIYIPFGIMNDGVCYKTTVGAQHLFEHRCQYLIHISDDNRFLKDGWDERLRSIYREYPDNLLCATWYDGTHRNVRTAFCISRELFEVLGFFFPPDYIHFYGDVILTRITAECGRFYTFEEYLVEDKNPKYGHGNGYKDLTHKRHHNNTVMNYDKKLYSKSQPFIDSYVQKLRGAIEAAKTGAADSKSTS